MLRLAYYILWKQNLKSKCQLRWPQEIMGIEHVCAQCRWMEHVVMSSRQVTKGARDRQGGLFFNTLSYAGAHPLFSCSKRSEWPTRQLNGTRVKHFHLCKLHIVRPHSLSQQIAPRPAMKTSTNRTLAADLCRWHQTKSKYEIRLHHKNVKYIIVQKLKILKYI